MLRIENQMNGMIVKSKKTNRIEFERIRFVLEFQIVLLKNQMVRKLNQIDL